MKKGIIIALVVAVAIAYWTQRPSYNAAARKEATTEALAAVKEPFNEMALTEKNMDMAIVGMKALERYREKQSKASYKYEKATEKEWKKFLLLRKEALEKLCKADICPYSELLLGKEEIAAYKGEKNMSGTFPGIEEYLKEVGKKYAKFERARNAFFRKYKKTNEKALETMRQQIEKADQSEKGKEI
jgi:hypothetical protein